MGAVGGVFVLAMMLTSCAANAGDDGDGGQEEITEAPMGNLDEAILGDWVSDEQGDPHLTFTEGGRVSGSDGCNGIGGEYSVSEDVATVTLGAATLKACPGVDDWLRGVTSVTVDGDTMHVMNESGEDIGTLGRNNSGK